MEFALSVPTNSIMKYQRLLTYVDHLRAGHYMYIYNDATGIEHTTHKLCESNDRTALPYPEELRDSGMKYTHNIFTRGNKRQWKEGLIE